MPFSQQISFPCELTLHETKAGLRLFRQPVAELDRLHQKEAKFSNRRLKPGEVFPLASAGELFRIKAEVSIPEGAKLTFNLRGFPVVLDSKNVNAGTGPHPVQGTVQTVEILVDRASVETFVNQGELSSTRNFQPHGNELSIKAEGGEITIRSLSVHPLKSIWSDEGRN